MKTLLQESSINRNTKIMLTLTHKEAIHVLDFLTQPNSCPELSSETFVEIVKLYMATSEPNSNLVLEITLKSSKNT